MIPRSKQRRHTVFGTEITARVRLLLDEVLGRDRVADIPSGDIPVCLCIDLVDRETIEVQQELEQDRVEAADVAVGNGSIAQLRLSSQDRLVETMQGVISNPASPAPRKHGRRSMKAQMTLLSGSAESQVTYRGDGGRMYYRAYAHRMEIHFQVDRAVLCRFSDPENLGILKIKAEISAPARHHPQAWAKNTEHGDPGAQLAFHLTLTSLYGREHSFYASVSGEKAAKKANSFVDWMLGTTDEEIAQRPRRYLLIQSKPEYTETVLKPFIGGAYTDDDGNVL
ncbi:hypothetical protein BJX65DRAFT_287218 [Aspergillus insuetus]